MAVRKLKMANASDQTGSAASHKPDNKRINPTRVSCMCFMGAGGKAAEPFKSTPVRLSLVRRDTACTFKSNSLLFCMQMRRSRYILKIGPVEHGLTHAPTAEIRQIAPFA